MTIDQNDPTGNTVYVGTGEANICGSGCVAGTGLYKSTDGGDTWTGPIGKPEFAGKGIGQIVIKPGSPNVLYVGSTTALRGMTSVCCSGVTRPVPGAAKWGLYKSTDGGANWSFIHNGSVNVASCTGDLTEFTQRRRVLAARCQGGRARSVQPEHRLRVVVCPRYLALDRRGRNLDADQTVLEPRCDPDPRLDRGHGTAGGATRMYAYEGNAGQDTSRLFRSDDANGAAPAFTNLTSADVADSGWAWHGNCDPQCWYDQFVYTPKGYPDIVYVGGDYSYGQTIANKRGVVMSTDAGVSGTDMTFDGTDMLHPNGLHPDQHSLVTVPGKPFQFFETNDGGVMRSSGQFVDRSSWCDDPNRGLDPTEKARCQQMLSRIPSELQGVNKGLSTLQFQSLSVSPFNSKELQGGTQDNGTWENYGSPVKWGNTMIGDGGQSGFDVAKPEFRFHNFTGVSTDVNFNNGNIADWIWISDPVQHPGTQFYAPVISDPKVAGTLFAGTGLSVYRTKTYGLGTMTMAEANQHCNEWTGDFAVQCGDWERAGSADLTDASYGDRAGLGMSAVERTKADSSSAWAATITGRVFVSKNADADPASAVSWTRIDDDAVTPNRFVSSIFVDPTNGNHAWISYSGYDANISLAPCGGARFPTLTPNGRGSASPAEGENSDQANDEDDTENRALDAVPSRNQIDTCCQERKRDHHAVVETQRVEAEPRADRARRCDPTLSRSPRGSRHQPRRRPAADPDNGRIEMAARSLFLTSRLIEDVNDRFAVVAWRLGRPADQVHHLLQRLADPLRCNRWVDRIDPCDCIPRRPPTLWWIRGYLSGAKDN